MMDSVETDHAGGGVPDSPTVCASLSGSDERGSGGGAGVGRSELQSSFLIQARQLVVPDVATVFKTIGLSFSFDGLDRDADVGFVRNTQQSNSGLDLLT